MARAGTLYLSGTNSYSGATTVENGTLILTDNEAVEDGGDLSVGNDLAAFGSVSPAFASKCRNPREKPRCRNLVPGCCWPRSPG